MELHTVISQVWFAVKAFRLYLICFKDRVGKRERERGC